MLAQPAFRLTSDDFLSRQDLAVTFLGRNGVEIGKRGLKQDATVPLSEFPDHLLKAVFATEDRRFYDHFGIDPVGLLRAVGQCASLGRGAGRLDAHPAARQEHLPDQ